MAQIITQSGGTVNIVRSIYDVNLGDTITLVSALVTLIDGVAPGGQPAWFTDAGLSAQSVVSGRETTDHTAQVDLDAVIAAGVESFEYEVIVSDGSLQSERTFSVDIDASLGQPAGTGPVRLFWVRSDNQTWGYLNLLTDPPTPVITHSNLDSTADTIAMAVDKIQGRILSNWQTSFSGDEEIWYRDLDLQNSPTMIGPNIAINGSDHHVEVDENAGEVWFMPGESAYFRRFLYDGTQLSSFLSPRSGRGYTLRVSDGHIYGGFNSLSTSDQGIFRFPIANPGTWEWVYLTNNYAQGFWNVLIDGDLAVGFAEGTEKAKRYNLSTDTLEQLGDGSEPEMQAGWSYNKWQALDTVNKRLYYTPDGRRVYYQDYGDGNIGNPAQLVYDFGAGASIGAMTLLVL